MGLKNEVAKAGLPCLRDYTQISFPFVCQAETKIIFSLNKLTNPKRGQIKSRGTVYEDLNCFTREGRRPCLVYIKGILCLFNILRF